MYRRYVLVLAVALLCACRDPVGVEGDWPPSSVPREVLLATPVRIEIEGRFYELETFLWRDFAPVSPPDGRPLAAVVYLGATDLQDADPALDVDRIWVMFGDDARESPLVDQQVWEPSPYRIRRFADGGPKWPPDSLVEVIVRVRGSGWGDVLLRAPEQRIHRTD